MRRRQAYATEASEDQATIADVASKVLEKPVKKGYCKVCGKRVGRGVYGHQQKCNGKLPA